MQRLISQRNYLFDFTLFRLYAALLKPNNSMVSFQTRFGQAVTGQILKIHLYIRRRLPNPPLLHARNVLKDSAAPIPDGDQ